MNSYRPLFPYFGGKSRVSNEVWQRFGNVKNYVEPFFGSGAVLFKRPHAPQIETINDKDGYVANFWRAIQSAPDEVAHYADFPVSEVDLHARHQWLVERKLGFTDWLIESPDHCDTKVAGWWVWGICQWIGGGWCTENRSQNRTRPHLSDAGMGINAPSRQLPHLGNAGTGIHAPSRQLPHLGNAGRGINAGRLGIIQEFANRLRNVRVCCGNWERVCSPAVTLSLGITGVFLDPPYTDRAERDMNLYAEDSGSVGYDVASWAKENGDNPLMRIAMCGYEGEYDFPANWECFAWKANGGYGSHNNENATRERIWFSPHCLVTRPTLFSEYENA